MLRASALLVDTAAAEVAVGDETSEACAVACYGMWAGRRERAHEWVGRRDHQRIQLAHCENIPAVSNLKICTYGGRLEGDAGVDARHPKPVNDSGHCTVETHKVGAHLWVPFSEFSVLE